ncbi:MAG: biotin/lipoyl-binding protein, partial [Geminicoccaceae bacterium]
MRLNMSAVMPTLSMRGTRVPMPAGGHAPGSFLPPYPTHDLLDAAAPRTRALQFLGLAVFLAFVGGFGVWSALAPLAEAAIAPGVIKVEGSRRTIQHLEGGIVREILVHDGDKVRPGQVLMRLDEVQSGSTLETQRALRWALLAQDAALSAEAARAKEVTFPTELLTSTEPRAVDAVAGQKAVFAARTANLDSQIRTLQARIEQQQAVTAGARGQLAATRRQLDLIRQEEAMRHGLVSQGLARLPDLLALQRSMAGLEGTIQDLNGQIDRAAATIAEAQRQIEQA